MAFPASVAAYAVAVVLLIAVVERVVAPRALTGALRAHGVVPRGLVGAVVAAVVVVEVALAVAVVVWPSPPVFAAAALLFTAFAGYSRHVVASGRGGPCGCGGVETPMGPWVTGRAAALAALAVLAAAAHGSVLPLSSVDEQLVVALLAAVTVGLLLWHLPAAMTRYPEVAR